MFRFHKSLKSNFILCIEDAFATVSQKDAYTYLNDDFSKYFAIFQQSMTSVIFVFNSSSGGLMEAKHIAYPATLAGTTNSYCGKLSNNRMLVSFTSSDPIHYIDILNTDDWEQLSYTSTKVSALYKVSTLSNSDQIILSYGTTNYFSLKVAYNKLNLTEVFTE